jgi:hypothetical protein
MTNRADFAELFDIDMDELAGMLALVTPHRLGGLKCLPAIEPQPPQDAENRCSRDTGLARDLRSGPALTPQRLDARDGLGRRRAAQAMRTRGAIVQACNPFGAEPRDPFAHRARADADGSPQPPLASARLRQPAAPWPLDRTASEAHSYERPFGSSKVRQSFSNFSLPRPEPNGQPVETPHLGVRFYRHPKGTPGTRGSQWLPWGT